jgi:hypothetical protein
MIWLGKTETWAVVHQPEMVEALLRIRVKPSDQQQLSDRKEPNKDYLFNGKVFAESASISRIIYRPDNFLPLIKLQWIGSESGSLVMIRYHLFGSTLMFLIFWTSFMLLAAIVGAFVLEDYPMALSFLAISALSYWVSIANFNRRVKEDSRILKSVLE